jgi:hypothetical protein
LGVPVLPDEVPGAAVSPGSRICSRAKDAAAAGAALSDAERAIAAAMEMIDAGRMVFSLHPSSAIGFLSYDGSMHRAAPESHRVPTRTRGVLDAGCVPEDRAR